MKFPLAALVIFCLPAFAFAADDADSDALKPGTVAPRFFPLDRNRAVTVPVKSTGPIATTPKLRSDTSAMQNGFFRYDRQKLAPSPIQHAIVVVPETTSSIGPRIISGARTSTPLAMTPTSAGTSLNTAPLSPIVGNPIMSLFNPTQAPTTPAPFRNTLLNHVGGSSGVNPAMSDSPASVLMNPQILPSTNAKSEKLIQVH